jgi:hypothetical protein
MSVRRSSSLRGQDGAGYHRDVVASFSSYLEAEHAVDYLVERRFPLQRMAIVGQGLRLVPGEVPGGRAVRALEAGLAGAVVGGLALLVAALLDFGIGDGGLTYAAPTTGAVCGLLGALAAEVTAIGRRVPGSEIRLFADRYDIVADVGIADAAATAIDDGQVQDGPG